MRSFNGRGLHAWSMVWGEAHFRINRSIALIRGTVQRRLTGIDVKNAFGRRIATFRRMSERGWRNLLWKAGRSVVKDL
jgi:hypothetical protein